jgi:hypothetical protein
MKHGVVALVAAIAIGLLVVASRPAASTIVQAGDDLQQVIDVAPSGAVIELGPGVHGSAVTLHQPVTLTGLPGAILRAPATTDAAIAVLSDDVTLRGFEVEGGSTGILVREAEAIVVDKMKVVGSDMHGVEIADGSAQVSSVEIHGLLSPMAQGIEIRNSEGRPVTVVEGSTISGGQEGIVSHVSRVRIEGNDVSHTTLRGIAVTEMSRGSVLGNSVVGAGGAGLYCGDMSRCEFRGNEAAGVVASGPERSRLGWGLLVHYHSSASSHDDLLSGTAGVSGVFGSSHMWDRSPLRLGQGWRGVAPGVIAVAAAMIILLLIRGLVRRVLAPATVPEGMKKGQPHAALSAALLAGLAVQTFHMAEHSLQVFRVYFDGVPSRGGFVGPIVEAEWIHFVYNLAVLGFLVAVLVMTRAGSEPGSRRRRGYEWATVAVVIQGYHFVEHAIKVTQHLATGARVNPGLAGQAVDLVWFHFAINLAVYVAFLAVAWAGLPRMRPRLPWISGRRTSVPAPFGHS